MPTLFLSQHCWAVHASLEALCTHDPLGLTGQPSGLLPGRYSPQHIPAPLNQHPVALRKLPSACAGLISWDIRFLVHQPRHGLTQVPREHRGVVGNAGGRAGGDDSPVAEEAALNDLHDEIRGLSLGHVGVESVPGGETTSGVLSPELFSPGRPP